MLLISMVTCETSIVAPAAIGRPPLPLNSTYFPPNRVGGTICDLRAGRDQVQLVGGDRELEVGAGAGGLDALDVPDRDAAHLHRGAVVEQQPDARRLQVQRRRTR